MGMTTKYCDLDNRPGPFKKKFPIWPGGSVARLAIDTSAPSTASDSRGSALDAIERVLEE